MRATIAQLDGREERSNAPAAWAARSRTTTGRINERILLLCRLDFVATSARTDRRMVAFPMGSQRMQLEQCDLRLALGRNKPIHIGFIWRFNFISLNAREGQAPPRRPEGFFTFIASMFFPKKGAPRVIFIVGRAAFEFSGGEKWPGEGDSRRQLAERNQRSVRLFALVSLLLGSGGAIKSATTARKQLQRGGNIFQFNLGEK